VAARQEQDITLEKMTERFSNIYNF
jgi:hypothetical protein